ncbi:glycosyltransferase [Tamlana sp. 62-3]|uniref:Glycosyltransferase n=1 Tax=Neotamlana sargassicola TaxID=2883125 RepID=A0A9X1I7F0_9FLAO|nr:glycosyltransferase [Tamlana sargassicola]MCB4809216.1 glycosyltransferase [Tamlana sargassicola]
MKPQTGGPCQGIRNIIPELIKHGVHNEVVCLDAPDEQYGVQDDFVIHKLGQSQNPWGYQKDLINWLVNNFNRFDIVVIHGIWLYNSFATVKALKKYKRKNKKYPMLYLMPHGMLDPYFQKVKERRKKAIRNSIYWFLIENNVVNSVDGLLFTCQQELLLARESFPNYKPKKELNISYGIPEVQKVNNDMSRGLKEKIPQWNGKPFILFLSRIHQKKGVDLLIKAYLSLQKKHKDLPQLIIAGPGLNTNYGKQMLELARTSSNVLFPGMLKGNCKWAALHHAEIFMLPSHQENFGIAVVEALASETSVVITNKVNIFKEIVASNAGIVCNDDLYGVQNALEHWYKMSNIQKIDLSKNARKVYTDLFTVESAALRFIETLK